MADLHFYCAVCGHALRLGSEHAGGLAECPACRRMVPVPGMAPKGGWLGVFSPEILAVEIKFLCRGCQSKLRIDARREGRKLDCPHCRRPNRIPTWSQLSATPPATPASLTPEEIAFLSEAPDRRSEPAALGPT